MATQQLKVGWLYGSKMNIYGDRGNVLALEQRAKWRDISVEVVDIGMGEAIPDDIDVFFWGGGQDGEQIAVSKDIAGEKGEALKAAVHAGAAILGICGGYQLLGHEYVPHAGESLPGVGLLDVRSVAGDTRFIGNVVIDTDAFGPLVGFENHSGLTWLGSSTPPLGSVRVGRGNNGQDGTEGAMVGTAIGCYLHGALLPKNPRLTDWLIETGLRRRYGHAELAPLDDQIEQRANVSAISRAVATR